MSGADTVDSTWVGPAVGRAPRRTCVGCRQAADKADLLRVVAAEGVLSPDPRARRPGRGAYLHPDLGCLDAAELRRAFPRALRVPGPLDGSAVRSYVEHHSKKPHAQEAGPTSMSAR